MAETITRLKKSERLIPAEHEQFKGWVNNLTRIDVAEALGVDRLTVARVYDLGRASTATINKIREKLKEQFI